MRVLRLTAFALALWAAPSAAAASESWQEPQQITEGASLFVHASAMARDGSSVVVWQSADDRVFAAQRPAHGRFDAPIELGGPSAHYPRPVVAVDRRGNAVVAWARRHDPETVQVEAVRLSREGVLSHAGAISARTRSVESPKLVAAGDGSALLVWVTGNAVVWGAAAPSGEAFGPTVRLSPRSVEHIEGLEVGIGEHAEAMAVWTSLRHEPGTWEGPGGVPVPIGRDSVYEGWAARYSGGRFLPTQQLPWSRHSGSAVAPSGEAVMTWHTGEPSAGSPRYLWQSVAPPGGQFGEPQLVYTVEPGQAPDRHLVPRADGSMVMWWWGAGGRYYSIRSPAGEFTAPAELDDPHESAAGLEDFVGDADGDIAWHGHTREDSGPGMSVAFWRPGGAVEPRERLPYSDLLALGPEGTALAAWSQPGADGQSGAVFAAVRETDRGEEAPVDTPPTAETRPTADVRPADTKPITRRRLRVALSCSARCTFKARGRVRAGGMRGHGRIRPKRIKARENPRSVGLRLSRRARRVVKRAERRGRPVRVALLLVPRGKHPLGDRQRLRFKVALEDDRRGASAPSAPPLGSG